MDFLKDLDSKVKKVFLCKNAELLALWKKFEYTPQNMTHQIIRIIEETAIPKLDQQQTCIEKIQPEDLNKSSAMWGFDNIGRLFIATKRNQTKSCNGKITEPYSQLETFYQTEVWAPNAWGSYGSGDRLLAHDLNDKLFPLFDKLLRGEEIEYKSHTYYTEKNPDFKYVFKAKLFAF